MSGPEFVDTNVLLYAYDTTERRRHTRARETLDRLWAGRLGRTSLQVLQEFYVNVTRANRPVLAVKDARDVVRGLLTWKPVEPDGPLLLAAWELQDRFSLSWWDALIVAAARRSGARTLLTEDLQDGQDFGGVRVVNPFRADATA